MKREHSQLKHLRLAACVAAMILVAPAAHAWTTIDTKTNGDGTPKFTDPDVKVEQFGNGDVPGQSGNGSFRFDVGRSNNAFSRPSDNGFGAAGQFIPMPGQLPERR